MMGESPLVQQLGMNLDSSIIKPTFRGSVFPIGISYVKNDLVMYDWLFNTVLKVPIVKYGDRVCS